MAANLAFRPLNSLRSAAESATSPLATASLSRASRARHCRSRSWRSRTTCASAPCALGLPRRHLRQRRGGRGLHRPLRDLETLARERRVGLDALPRGGVEDGDMTAEIIGALLDQALGAALLLGAGRFGRCMADDRS